MAALPQAPPIECGIPPPNVFDSESFTADQGLHPLQHWIYGTHIFWPLALDAHPRNAVGLEVDWGESLDNFAMLSSTTDVGSQEEIVRELLLQLEGLLADRSDIDAALLVWSYFIQAIDRQLEEGADIPRLLELLGGYLFGTISPLFQDAAAYCGCAMVSHWVQHQQPPSQAAAPEISGFLTAVASLVEMLGQDGLQLVKEGEECLDPSSHPGCRAAALAYSSYRAAMDLHSCQAFRRVEEVLGGLLDAGFGLAKLFGAPPGELLPPWQLSALQRLLHLFHEPQDIVQRSRELSEEGVYSEREVLQHCQLMMPGCIAMMEALTGPYKVAVLEQEREGADLQAEQMLHHLVASARSMGMVVQEVLHVDAFLEGGGIPAVLSYLRTYAQLQPSLPWIHTTHVVAVEAESALVSLLSQSALLCRGGQPERYRSLQQVLLENGAVDSLLEVVGSAPSIMETVRHFHGDDPWPAHGMHTAAAARQPSALSPGFGAQQEPSAPGMAAGAEQQGQQAWPHWRGELIFRGIFCFDAILKALYLLSSLGRHSSAWREALLHTDCARLLIERMAHLEEGLPLGSVERRSLSPVASWIVREWTGPAMTVIANLLAPALEKGVGTEGGRGLVELSAGFAGQVKELMTPAALVRLLKWRAQPQQPVQRSGTAQKSSQDTSALDLEHSVLLTAHAMVVTFPGLFNEVECEEEFMAYMEEVLVNSNLGSIDFGEVQRRCVVLIIFKDMVKHSDGARMITRFLHVGGTAATSLFCTTLKSVVQGLSHSRRLDPSLPSHLWESPAEVEGAETGVDAQRLKQAEAEFLAGFALATTAVQLLEALLAQGAPQLRLEAGHLKAEMKRLHLLREATAAQASRDERIREAGKKALACIKRVEELAELEQQAAEAAAEAAAAELLAAEEAEQQASAKKASKRQRQKAAKQAQQAAVAAEQEEQERQQREEREQREREEQEHKAQEKAQRAAEAAAAALQAEQEAAQQRAAAKATKRQRKKTTKQAQQEAAGASAVCPTDASTATSQPSSSTAVAASMAAATPEKISLTAHDSLQQLHLQGRQQEAGQAAAEPLTPLAAQVTTPAQVGTPQLAEARGGLAPAAEDDGAEFKALLSLLIPSAAEPSTPSSTAPPTASPAGGSGSGSGAPMEQAQQQGTAPTPALAAVLRRALSGQQLRDPVVAADGWTYERQAITAWLAAGETTSPMTGQTLGGTMLRPNFALRQLLGGRHGDTV